jgi:uncharacterized membrane protein
MADLLNVLMRWLHISSVVTLIGGMIFGRMVMWTSAQSLAPDAREGLSERAAAHFRPLMITAMTFLVISGIYNLLSNPGHTVLYHALLGIKLLLVAHVFAVAILVGQPGNKRRGRQMAGAAISGLVIIGISAYLRRIF